MPVFLQHDGAAERSPGEPQRPLAVTEGGRTWLAPEAMAHPARPHILAHEAAHRLQFHASSQPTGGRSALEADAERGAHALRSGQPYTPRVAAAAGMALTWPPGAAGGTGAEQWFPDPQREGEREATDLATAGLAGPEQQIAITTSSEAGPGTESFEYAVNVEASERTGSILSTTGIRVVHESNPTVSVAGPVTVAIDLEMGLAPTHLEPGYPYAIHYTRMVTYTDSDGRTAEVDIEGHVYFTAETWQQQVGGVQQPSFEQLLRLRGDDGDVIASFRGRSSITGYFANYAATGTSVDIQTQGAVQLLGLSGGMSLVSPSSPAAFLDPRQSAGQQFVSLRVFLMSIDARELARRLARQSGTTSEEPSWLDDLAGGLADLLGPLFEGLPDLGGDWDILPDWLDEWLNDVGEDIAGVLGSVLGPVAEFLEGVGASLGEWWDSLPPWARGVLTAVAKFVGTLGALAAVAGLVVLVSEGAIAFGAAMLVIGTVALAGTFVYSMYQRAIEAWNAGDPLAFMNVPMVALLDTIGLSGVIEAITDRSILTGREYGRTEEERWEAGTSGFLQLVGTFFMVRGARGGPRGQTVTPEVRGPMGDFNALPPERLPVLPEGHAWVRSANGEWTILRDPGAPEVPIEISIYSDGQGHVNYNIRSGTEVLQSDAITRPQNDTYSGGERLPEVLRGTGEQNPFREPATNRTFDKGHGVDYADALEGPGVRNSNLDPVNFTPQAAWWNRWVRNHLVARIRSQSGGYREMPIYDQAPSVTANGTPIPREFVFVETSSTGQPVRAWRIPNDPTLTGRSQSVLGQYEIPLSDIPEVMVNPTGGMRAPGTVIGPAVIGGERGRDEEGP